MTGAVVVTAAPYHCGPPVATIVPAPVLGSIVISWPPLVKPNTLPFQNPTPQILSKPVLVPIGVAANVFGARRTSTSCGVPGTVCTVPKPSTETTSPLDVKLPPMLPTCVDPPVFGSTFHTTPSELSVPTSTSAPVMPSAAAGTNDSPLNDFDRLFDS